MLEQLKIVQYSSIFRMKWPENWSNHPIYVHFVGKCQFFYLRVLRGSFWKFGRGQFIHLGTGAISATSHFWQNINVLRPNLSSTENDLFPMAIITIAIWRNFQTVPKINRRGWYLFGALDWRHNSVLWQSKALLNPENSLAGHSWPRYQTGSS